MHLTFIYDEPCRNLPFFLLKLLNYDSAKQIIERLIIVAMIVFFVVHLIGSREICMFSTYVRLRAKKSMAFDESLHKLITNVINRLPSATESVRLYTKPSDGNGYGILEWTHETPEVTPVCLIWTVTVGSPFDRLLRSPSMQQATVIPSSLRNRKSIRPAALSLIHSLYPM